MVKGYGKGERYSPSPPTPTDPGSPSNGSPDPGVPTGKGGETAGSAFGYLLGGGGAGGDNGQETSYARTGQGQTIPNENSCGNGRAMDGSNVVMPGHASEALERSSVSTVLETKSCL